MRRLRMLTGLSGPGYSLGGGDERDFPEDEAIRLVAAGFAVPVDANPVEQAVKPAAPEKRVPFGGKGDHDGDGRPGGAKKPQRSRRG